MQFLMPATKSDHPTVTSVNNSL